MDAAYLSAISALAGSLIGSLSSLTASWLGNQIQFKTQERAAELHNRQQLFRDFIAEASKWYADAFEHDDPKVSNLVNLYTLVSRMRIMSSPTVVASADRVIRTIIQAYLSPNKSFRDVFQVLDNAAMDPLREFSDSCRVELDALRRAAKLQNRSDLA
jgi:hypothetical protein